ncbi:hypothetical protein MBLNU230_g0459t1 [Neophaeotheca triangularis]
MLGPLKTSWTWTRTAAQKLKKRPTFNFISVHYLYLIAWSLLGSVIVFGIGGMDFVDALFFSCGAATQSGLNTIDINDLFLGQQVLFFFMACVCNPIFINTIVVFVRLYWFEKRFQGIVKESRNKQRSKTRSRSKSEAKLDPQDPRVELGVAGRTIKVLHETTVPNGMSNSTAKQKAAQKVFSEKQGLQQATESVSSTTPSGNDTDSGESSTLKDKEETPEKRKEQEEGEPPAERKSFLGLNPLLGEGYHGANPRLNKGITFADEVPNAAQVNAAQHGHKRTPSNQARMSAHPNNWHNVEFVARQKRNATEGPSLKIPGPRDFDRGDLPAAINEQEGTELSRLQTRNTLQTVPTNDERDHRGGPFMAPTVEDEESPSKPYPKRAITIDEPDHPAHRARTHEKEGNDEDDEDDAGLSRRRSPGQILSKITSGIRRRRSDSRVFGNSHRSNTHNRTFNSWTTARTTRNDFSEPMPYLSYQPTVGRNSAFVNLTSEQREELGGIEYRALLLISKILICYYVGFHLLGMVVLLPWITNTHWNQDVSEFGIDPAWWGIFTPQSLFNDLGYTLTPNSMISFQTAALPLILGSFLIIIGNTGFPCMLRFIIWGLSKLVPKGSSTWEELLFLLEHPRRCFTLLFPSKATWWLFWILVLLNGVDLIFFIILDLDDEAVTTIPLGYRILAGWFQATSTRTAGFSVVNLAELHPAIQVSYMVMMYISVFPIAVSVRRTNVYEEKSLGVWGGEESSNEGDEKSYVGHHLRRQLSFDLWYVFLGLFIIAIVEGNHIADDTKDDWTMFAVLFEIVSAYGTVGLSLGYESTNTSFSGQFHPISKLIIIAMMLRGRHRGLPYALDKAILLPSENLNKKEGEEAEKRYGRTNTAVDENGEPIAADAHGDDENYDNIRSISGDPNVARASTDTTPLGRRRTRRGSGLSTYSAREPGHQRRMTSDLGRRLSTVLQGALSAGPTTSKHD